MRDLISEVINDYIDGKRIMNEYKYWGQDDIDLMRSCKDTLSSVYDRMLKNGFTKNVFVVQQLGDVINRLDKLVK